MDQQYTIPEWILTLIGRHAVLAENERIQLNATIASQEAELTQLRMFRDAHQTDHVTGGATTDAGREG